MGSWLGPAQPSRPAYMAAGSAFSLLEEFYFFAALAATSILDHLVRKYKSSRSSLKEEGSE